MTQQQRDPAERVFRFASIRPRSNDAPAIALRPGLNVLVAGSEDDRHLLRSTFRALTSATSPGLAALVEVGGTMVELDVDFARSQSLDGRPPPVVEVPASTGSPSTEGKRDRSVPSGTDQRIAEVVASERRLVSELELTSRELRRARDSVDPADSADFAEPLPATSRDAADLHPADVAVMCDRLRELLVSDPRPELLELVGRLEEVGRARVYRIHREEALGQLMEECEAAQRSAREYLATPGDGVERDGVERDGVERDGTEGKGTDRERSRHLSGTERLEAATREAHTIARLDLLEELRDFWRTRLDDLNSETATGAELLEQANEMLTSVGELPSGSPRDAAARLRELARRGGHDRANTATVDELVASLGSYVGAHADGLAPGDLLAAAEARLARGARGGSSGGVDGGRDRSRDDQRITELEATEHSLRRRLDAVRAELAALERGRQNAPHPNPFGASGRGSGGPGPGSPGSDWSLLEAVTRARSVPGIGTLPVLLIEPVGAANALSGIDPLSVAALGIAGQVIWLTDRAEVVPELESLGEDVGIIGA